LYLTEWRGRRDVLNAPFRKFAADLKTSANNADFILSGNYWVGGNLRLWFPDKHIFSPDLAPPDIRFGGQRCLLAWDADHHLVPPEELIAFARAFTGSDQMPKPSFIEEKWKYHHGKMMRLGVLTLDRSPADKK
jgi:hypothetical protein